MNSIFEITVIVAVVGFASLYMVRRGVKALRSGRPSCCADEGDSGQLAGTSACADSGSQGSDGRLNPRPSYCAGCTGCGPSQ